MPTFQPLPRFARDFAKLTPQDQERFRRTVREQFVPDLIAGKFRSGLRIKGVQGAPGVYEMTWAPDGRATWQYGPEVTADEKHVIWRRVGTHALFDPGPP